MRILLANKFFYLRGGAEKVFFQERDFLIDQNIEVIDFAMSDANNKKSIYADYFVSNINYQDSIGFAARLSRSLGFIHSNEAVHKINKISLSQKPDIAHFHNIYHQLTPSILPALKKQGIKIVLTLHDGKLICPSCLMLNKVENCTDCKGKHFWRPIVNNCQNSISHGALLMLEAYFHKLMRSYDCVDQFIAPSQFIADLVSQRIPIEKIRILHNGMNPTSLVSVEDDGYILFFGRLSSEKGIDTLLKAHQAMQNPMPLLIAGTGPLAERIATSASKNVVYVGYKESKELDAIIRRASFVVTPSECNENCSMVILEAMAQGKAVIASHIGGIPEQIENQKTGLLFETGNSTALSRKMDLLATDKEKRKRMGDRAKEKLEKEYSLTSHCHQLMEVYDTLLR